ncbi:DUF4250 domain-containing protein [Shewanella waksmanii]|uniref:DUF4250 domain-containing protein n=1 Tax=Shewanella waksmanii TaxID=213783 RepID=UPI0037363F25
MEYNLRDVSGEILVGIVNERLRLDCQDRQALFYQLDLPSEQLEQRLMQAGFYYDPVSNQYR